MSNQKVPKGIDLQFTSWSVTRNEGYKDPSVSLPTTQPGNNAGKIFQKGRPGGGWDDEDDQPTLQTTTKTTSAVKTGPNMSSIGQQQSTQVQPLKSTPKETQNDDLNILTPEDLMNRNCDYENKLINDIVQPGGARIKQSEQILDQFCKACETLSPSVIGSLLLHKLYSEVPWIVKAKTLYGIEALVRKVVKFQKYFKQHQNIVQNFPIDQDANANQLTNILNTTIKVIENPNYVEMSASTGPTFKMGNVKNLLDTPQTTQQNHVKSAQVSLIDDDLLQQETVQTEQTGFKFIKKQNSTADSNAQQQQQQQQQQNNTKLNPFSFINNNGNAQHQQQQATYNTQNQAKSFQFIKGSSNNISTQPPITQTQQKTTTINDDLFSLDFTSQPQIQQQQYQQDQFHQIPHQNIQQQQQQQHTYYPVQQQQYQFQMGIQQNYYPAYGIPSNTIGFNNEQQLQQQYTGLQKQPEQTVPKVNEKAKQIDDKEKAFDFLDL